MLFRGEPINVEYITTGIRKQRQDPSTMTECIGAMGYMLAFLPPPPHTFRLNAMLLDLFYSLMNFLGMPLAVLMPLFFGAINKYFWALRLFLVHNIP